MTTRNDNLESLMRLQFVHAKFWWIVASVLRFLIVIINAGALVFSGYGNILAIFAALITIIQPLSQWYSDRVKGSANSLLRKIEMAKGLGWEIKPREISDLLASLPKRIKDKAKASNTTIDSYFFHQGQPSSKQLLQHLEESAWWTKHQARTLIWVVGTFSCLVVGLAIIVLVISLQNALAQNTANNIAKVTISVIAFIFSGGYIRLTEEYYRLSVAADQAEERACTLKNRPDLTEGEAIRIVHEYQIARSGSPLLPEWLWKMKQHELNNLWLQRAQEEQ